MLADYKAHQRPPHPPPRRKAGRASSPLPGEGTAGGLPNPESGVGSDWEKKKIRTHPSSCLPDPSAIPTSAASAPPCSPRNGPAPWRMQVKALTQRTPPRASTQCPFLFLHGQSAPPRADSACSALKQTTHRLVYLQQRKLFVCREEHTACNAIRTRQVLVLLYTYSYRGAHPECLWDTANRNKLQQISTDTHRAVAEWQKLTPVPPHVLLCCLADYVTRLWRLAHLLDSFHMCSEHGYAGGVP